MGLACKPTGKFKSQLMKVEKFDKQLREEAAAARAAKEVKKVEVK